MMLGICAICMTAPVLSQTLSSHLTKDSVLVGDLIEWQWILELPAQYDVVQVPQFTDSIAQLLVLRQSPIDTLSNSDKTVLKQSITLSGYDSLDVTLPVLKAQVKDVATGQLLDILSQESYKVQVRTMLVEDTDTFRPIKDIIQVKNPDKTARILEHIIDNFKWYFILSILIALAIIAWAIYRLVKALKSKNLYEKPAEKAIRKIYELDHSQLWEQSEYKQYYTELSAILKEYIHDTLHIKTDKLTSTELVRELKKMRALKGVHKPMRDILFTADIAKFAKGIPQETYRLSAIQQSEMIIHTIEQYIIEKTQHGQ